MTRAISSLGALSLLLFPASAVWPGRLEQGGPAHAEVVLDGRIPATIYLPGKETGREAFLDVPPREERRCKACLGACSCSRR